MAEIQIVQTARVRVGSALPEVATDLIPILLALLVSVFGPFTVAETVRIVVLTYSPVLSWDQWHIINTLIRSHGHPTLLDFWAQHNEHRIPTVRFFSLLDLFVFHGRSVSLYVEIFTLQLCHLVLFCALIFRFSRLSLSICVTLTGFFTYCFFFPLQMENFNWGFQIGFVLTSFAATVSFAAAVWCRKQIEAKNDGGKLPFAVCLLSASIAEGSNSHGLIAWPVLLFLSFALNFPVRMRSVVGAVAALGIGAFLIGFDPQCPPGTYSRALSHPVELPKFGLTYLGNSWSGGLPNKSAWPTSTESLTLLSIAVTIFLAVQCLRQRRMFSPLQVFLLGNLLFGIGSVAMTTIGRHRSGLEMAISSRYQTPALLYWVCFVALIAVSVPQITQLRLLVGQVCLLILMMSAAGRWAEMAHQSAERQFRLGQAWNAAIQDRFNDPAAASLFYSTDRVNRLSAICAASMGTSGPIRSFCETC